MKTWHSILLSAVVVVGCGHRDPIERLMHEVSSEHVPSYPFKPIGLAATATPEELISALSKRGPSELGHFNFASYKISEIRPVQTEPPISEKFTAVRLDTDRGQRIVLLRPMQNKTNWIGWYYKVYDAR